MPWPRLHGFVSLAILFVSHLVSHRIPHEHFPTPAACGLCSSFAAPFPQFCLSSRSHTPNEKSHNIRNKSTESVSDETHCHSLSALLIALVARPVEEAGSLGSVLGSLFCALACGSGDGDCRR